jgi:hypothetical protein
MFVMGHNYQVHPVYPSNTDDLEWQDPAPELDCKFPRFPDNEWNEVYYNTSFYFCNSLYCSNCWW